MSSRYPQPNNSYAAAALPLATLVGLGFRQSGAGTAVLAAARSAAIAAPSVLPRAATALLGIGGPLLAGFGLGMAAFELYKLWKLQRVGDPVALPFKNAKTLPIVSGDFVGAYPYQSYMADAPAGWQLFATYALPVYPYPSPSLYSVVSTGLYGAGSTRTFESWAEMQAYLSAYNYPSQPYNAVDHWELYAVNICDRLDDDTYATKSVAQYRSADVVAPSVPSFVPPVLTSVPALWPRPIPVVTFPSRIQKLVSLVQTLDPASRPVIDWERDAPVPLPWALIPKVRMNPYRAAEYQREAGYKVGVPVASVGTLPWLQEPFVVGTSQRALQRARPLGRAHVLSRPMGKEAKVRVQGYQTAMNLFSAFTESSDVVDAVYEALDVRLKREFWRANHRQPTLNEKLQIVMDNFEVWSPEQAVKNLYYQQLVDLYYGTQGQVNKKISTDLQPYGSLPFGFQFGSGYFR